MKQTGLLTRRELLHTAAVVAGGAAVTSTGLAGFVPPAEKPKLPTRPFGKTGREVCMLSFGAGALARRLEFDDAVAVVTYALDAGIMYVDTAESYKSEKHVGKAVAGRRNGLFLATKTLQRGCDGAMRELEQSLKLLGTDHLELWQVHSIGDAGETGEQALARLRKPDSVMKAMRRMKAQGVIDLIGFTGHTNPNYMMQILDANDLDFDTMLFAISAAVARKDGRGWEQRVLPTGRKKGLGLIAMKVFGGGKVVGKGADRASPAELLTYVWDRGVPVANVGLYSKKEVDAAVAALKAYKPKAQPQQEKPDKGAALPAAGCRDVALRERFRDVVLSFQQPGYRDACHGGVA